MVKEKIITYLGKLVSVTYRDRHREDLSTLYVGYLTLMTPYKIGLSAAVDSSAIVQLSHELVDSITNLEDTQ